MITHYKQVGIIEGTSSSDVDRYSIMNKQREIQRSASQQKIAMLRKSFENLIGAISRPDEVEEDSNYKLDNPFTSHTLKRDISLSVFNTPKKIVEVKERPPITSDFLLSKIKGYKPPVATGEEGAVAVESANKVERESLLPEF
jgi:hypothetical protein